MHGGMSVVVEACSASLVTWNRGQGLPRGAAAPWKAAAGCQVVPCCVCLGTPCPGMVKCSDPLLVWRAGTRPLGAAVVWWTCGRGLGGEGGGATVLHQILQAWVDVRHASGCDGRGSSETGSAEKGVQEKSGRSRRRQPAQQPPQQQCTGRPQTAKNKLGIRDSNPGLPRDRRGFSPTILMPKPGGCQD